MNSVAYAAVESELDDAAAAVGAARTLMSQGNVVDLSGLENHIERMCDAITALPRGDRERLKPALVALIDSLNDLTRGLTDQHAVLSGELRELGSRHQAVSAYTPQRPGRNR